MFYPEPIQNLTATEQQAAITQAIADIVAISTSTGYASNCTRCQASLAAAKYAIQVAPTLGPSLLVQLCELFDVHSNATCELDFEATTYGSVWTQVLFFADVIGLDGQYICYELDDKCTFPNTTYLNTTDLFPKPKPATPKEWKASGTKVKVLHMSDIHLDPRYDVGAEAACTSGLCCRSNVAGAGTNGSISLASPLFGAYACDSPYNLAAAVRDISGRIHLIIY